MSLRTFTVFQDAPAIEMSKQNATSITEQFSSSSSLVKSATSLSSLASVAEKENLHPVTGELAAQGTSKKRKTAVLSTKSSMVFSTKKQTEPSESKPEPKRRKSSSSSKKGNSVARKERKGLSASKKTNKVASRRESPLPPVDEVGELEREGERITQVEIDSRCYELTVKPLADVTQAYDHYHQAGALEDGVSVEGHKFSSVKEASAEPEIRDYFSPSLSSSSQSSTALRTTPPRDVISFSTPERKQIYTAFTFTSPSPLAERTITARSTSVPLADKTEPTNAHASP